MKVDISPLRDEQKQTLREQDSWDSSQIDLESDSFSIEDPVRIDFTLTLEGDTILARGTYSTRLTMVCGRCLATYSDSLEGELEAMYLSSDEALRTAKEESDEALYFGRVRNETVDLGVVVRQDILVQCPMRPLCREDCEGLCPECGVNLNDEDCGHDQGNLDPRMEKFRDIAEGLDDFES